MKGNTQAAHIMGVGERLEMLAARVAEDTKAIGYLLDQATGLAPDINGLSPHLPLNEMLIERTRVYS